MCTFSTVYYTDNPESFVDGDTPYILAYSAIMLNTDLHSGMLKESKRMTKHQFVKNNM